MLVVGVDFLEGSTSTAEKESIIASLQVKGTIGVVTAQVEVSVSPRLLLVFLRVVLVHSIQDNTQVIVDDFKSFFI